MWTKEKNERRISLLSRKHAGDALTNAEWAELDRLQCECEDATGFITQQDFDAIRAVVEVHRIRDELHE